MNSYYRPPSGGYSRESYSGNDGSVRGASGSGGNNRKKKKKQAPALVLVVVDVVLIVVTLLVFAYFHHVNPIVDNSIDAVTLPAPGASAPAEAAAPEAQPDDTTAAAAATDTDTSEPTGDTHKFADKFLAEGEAPQKTDTTYVTHNVNVSVTTTDDGSGLVYHAADIYVRDVQYLKAAFALGEFGTDSDNRAYVDEAGARVNAFVAINGDQYSQRSDGVVVRDGVLYRDVPFMDVCVLNYDGSLVTYPQAAFSVDDIKTNGAWQVWSFGPLLLTDGQPMTSFNSTVTGANPRSAIGMVEPLHYILLAVDGRGSYKGISLPDLSQLMHDLGCVTAYNMDGGDTSAMAVDGKIYSAPSGDRRVSDIIYIGME